MRLALTLLASFVVLTTSAQIDFNKIMQQRAGGQGQGTGSGDGAGKGGGVKMVDDTDPFVPNEFIGSFRMEMHTYKGTEEEKNSPSNMRYWSGTDVTLTQMEMPEQNGKPMRMLVDLKGKWSYMLMTDEKGKKTAMKSRKQKMVMTTDSATAKREPVITVTMETKLIDGHTCTKVVVVSEDGTWTGWVAKDVKAPFRDIARAASQSAGAAQRRAMEKVDGMPLEFEWAPADGKSRMVCYIKELESGKVDPGVFSLDGYEVMDMPSFGR